MDPDAQPPDGSPLQHSPLTDTAPGAPPRLRRNRVDVSEYLDAGETDSLLDIAPGQRRMEDPLSLGLVSVAEARTLVDLFHQHLNPPLALLDPAYHTLAFMHETSYALLTAVLAAASRFFHGPETYRALLDHAQVLINRAVADGHCEIGMIQCLMVLSHFKETGDRTGWIKIGIALRFAYQNGLHKALEDVDIHRTSEADRAQLNLERTWFCLCCFDTTYSHLFMLPLAIPASQRGEVDKWAHNHLGLGPSSDLRLACSGEFLDIASQVLALKVNPTTKAYRAVILPQILAEIDRHMDKWFSGRLSRLAEYEETAIKIGRFAQSLTVHMMLIDDGIDAWRHIAEGLVKASMVVDGIEMISAHGNFLYFQDTASVHFARMIVFLHNYFRRFTPTQQSQAVDLMKRLNAACLAVPNVGSDGAPAAVARLIQRVLRALSSRSIAPSRAISPGPGPAQPEVSEAVMTDLDEFLATITAPDLGAVDDQCWSDLFGDALNELPFLGEA
jgi:hypothetical protein